MQVSLRNNRKMPITGSMVNFVLKEQLSYQSIQKDIMFRKYEKKGNGPIKVQ